MIFICLWQILVVVACYKQLKCNLIPGTYSALLQEEHSRYLADPAPKAGQFTIY